MAMGKKKRRQQEDLWVATSELPRTAGHPFYERLNGLFNEHGFDDFVEGLCAKFYADKMGRPSLAPGVYFRLLLVGYFEGIGSERGIAWRASDSLGLREFLGLKVSESPSDHSTISRTRRLIDVATHEAVFDWVLKRIGASGLLRGKTIGIDATTLEANAALRSIVRRDSEQGQEAVYANRRRIRGERGQRLLRQRGERLERPCAHLYGSGGMRRLQVRGHENVLKRLLIQVSAFNLGMLMRQSLGVGTPRGLQGRICALMLLILSLFKRLKGLFGLIPAAWPEKPNSATPSLLPSVGTT